VKHFKPRPLFLIPWRFDDPYRRPGDLVCSWEAPRLSQRICIDAVKLLGKFRDSIYVEIRP